ncbi:MAG TPA: hypothetical protein ENK18_05195 [Deltaproteobacteria bacterium]|nr:hypothetical protein [Deltaproteobacteria bacterium]
MSRVPDAIIERVHLGEANEEQRARVLADPEASARLGELTQLDTSFLAAHPATEIVPGIERRLHRAQTRGAVARRGRLLSVGGGLLVPTLALALALVVIPGERASPTRGEVIDPIDGVVRLKGLEPRLHVFHLDEGHPVRLSGGQLLSEGDQLQLGYTRGSASHGVLLSIDGRGTVTLHAPDSDDTQLLPGEHVIPHAYRLDDAPAFERFFLVTSEHPIDVERLLSAARALATDGDARSDELILPEDLVQQDLLIRKEAQ